MNKFLKITPDKKNTHDDKSNFLAIYDIKTDNNISVSLLYTRSRISITLQIIHFNLLKFPSNNLNIFCAYSVILLLMDGQEHSKMLKHFWTMQLISKITKIKGVRLSLFRKNHLKPDIV